MIDVCRLGLMRIEILLCNKGLIFLDSFTFEMAQILKRVLRVLLSYKTAFNSTAVLDVFFSVITDLFLLGVFKKWRQQKRKVDAENEKAFIARAILTRNFKARVLQAWRVVNQEQQIISPMVARRERKEMARYNELGILVKRAVTVVLSLA